MACSKSPDLVLQAICGHLCCHYAIRTLMADTARSTGTDPQRVSLIAALRIARRSIAQQGTFPPDERTVIDRLWRYAIQHLAARLLPKRHRRANPRVAKRKYVRWHVKRQAHHDWPQPTIAIRDAIHI